MSGSGVVMMQKFIETNGIKNSESPDIFLQVHSLLDKKLKRIAKIKELYEEDGDKAPITKCPECGSPTLVVHNCEFCGYAMIDYEASAEQVKEDSEPATRKKRVAPTEEKAEEDYKETEEPKKETKTRKKEIEKPTEEYVNKARRPGLLKIIDAHELELKCDSDKDDIKKIRIEILDVLLGIKPEPTTRKSKVATKKVKEEKEDKVDLKKAKELDLESMSEKELVKVIIDFKLKLPEVVKILSKKVESDEEFFKCVDDIAAAIKNMEETQKEEPKRRPARSKPAQKKGKLIDVSDLPESDAMEKMNEKELITIINKFGLKVDTSELKKGDLKDDDFFRNLDLIDAEIEKIANAINAGEEPTYPEEASKEAPARSARQKKVKASEPKLEEGNEVDEDHEDIDLDNADIDYEDINVEDLSTED